MNKTAGYGFTIIVPVFNEEDNIENLGKALLSYIPDCPFKACVLFIDDGSKDTSLRKLETLCGRNDDLFYVSFTKNSGLSAALKAGIDYTQSPLLGYMDADLQTVPEDFTLLLNAIGSHSMAIGYRADRKDSLSKRIQSKIANGFRRMMTGDGAIDTGCPLKVIRTDAAKKIPMFKGLHRFLPAMILLQEGGSYAQVKVRHFQRKAGKSKYSIWNRLRGPFADCFAYRWMKSRYINYSIGESDLNNDSRTNKDD